MTFVQLQYFVEIINHRSINAAAKACYVSYNAMYKSLKSLEKELQTDLVLRDATGVIPTPAGRKFYDDVVGILKTAETWKEFSQPPAHDTLVKICSTPFFINTGALQTLSGTLRADHILLDYQAIFPEYMKAQLLQQSDLVFLYPHTPNVHLHELVLAGGYRFEYLCSDDCKIFLNRNHLDNPTAATLPLADLHSFTPIRISNDYENMTPFDTRSFLKNFNDCLTVQRYEDALPLLLNDHTFLLLRSSMVPIIHNHYSEQIIALGCSDISTGTDYYIAWRPTTTTATAIFVTCMKSYCSEHYCQEPFFPMD